MTDDISINAWTGEDDGLPRASLGAGALAWLLDSAGRRKVQFLKAAALPDWNEWTDPRVGWGVVVASKGTFSDTDRMAGKDLEQDAVLQSLLASREAKQGKAPVFHYGAGNADGHSQVFLRNYAARKDLDLSSSLGLEDDQLPFYLLIYGSPEDIPWEFQYTLQSRHAVGRLDPAMSGIGTYVEKLINGWKDAAADPNTSLTWAVDHGSHDITHLMRNSVASRLHEAYTGDSDINGKAIFLDGSSNATDATGTALIAKLKEQTPGMIVTSSHGKTGPLNNLPEMVEHLGIPVDQTHDTLDLDTLFEDWMPDGAVWYAQACCSAGSKSPSAYQGLFDSTSSIGKVLEGVAHGGSHIAPLPSRLLGCDRPARAFFGQVEPTFNYTLRNPETKQVLTGALKAAFYDFLYQPFATGRILNKYHDLSATKFHQWQNLVHEFEQDPGSAEVKEKLLYTRTTAIDVDSLVLLGDPTAILPI